MDEILEPLRIDAAAPECADDPRGHGLAKSERIADRDDEVVDIQRVGIAQRESRQILGLDFEDGDVGLRIASQQFGWQLAPILQGDEDLVGVGDYMVVGQNVALCGIDDYAGPGADSTPLWLLVR